jgi:pimeloyl-ACP methyl ester carboxylesterase
MAKIGNEEIFLTDTGGDKPALLFVHGMTFDHTVWRSQVGAFSADFRVVSVDLRGHGRSTAANPDISFEDHAADLATLIDILGLKDVALVGWSMGGAIAQLFAATYSA